MQHACTYACTWPYTCTNTHDDVRRNIAYAWEHLLHKDLVLVEGGIGPRGPRVRLLVLPLGLALALAALLHGQADAGRPQDRPLNITGYVAIASVSYYWSGIGNARQICMYTLAMAW